MLRLCFSPTFDYEDDFDSETVQEETSSGSTHSITPTASLREPSITAATAEAAPINTSKQQKPLSSSSAAVDKPQPHHTSSLLTRNRQHSFLQHESAGSKTTGLCSPENSAFKLSPIHTRTANTGSGIANGSIMSDENSSVLSSESASSTSEAKGVTLTPLHAKQLTASDLFKSTPVSDKANYAISEGKLSTTTLSPLHATGSGVLKLSASDPLSPERKPVAAGGGSLAIGLSPVHTKLSSSHGRQLKVSEQTSPTQKQRDVDNGLLMHMRDTEEDTKPDIPKESTVSIPEDHLGPVPDQSRGGEQSLDVQLKSEQEDTAVSSPMKSLLETDKSGLGEDLAELQSALEAAGLPPMATKDEETPKEEPTQQSSESPKAADVSTKDTRVPQSAAPVDSKHKPLPSFTSESDEQDPTKVTGELKKTPGAMGFDLREAIRAIASEELTTISKEILKQQKHSVSQAEQPLQENHEIASASSDKKLECGTESLLSRGDGKASHASTYEGLEKLSDILADIEHDSETDKSTAKYDGSRKPVRSSARKLTSTLLKTGVKASASKEGRTSKVDARLSSKVKASVRTLSTSKSCYRTSSRLAELAVPKKVNTSPSATSVGSQAKAKHHAQSYRPGTSKSAPPKQSLSSGRAGLKQYSGTSAKSTSRPASISSRQHQIVIPTGSSGTVESQSDSEDEIIHAIHERRGKTNEDRPEIKMDAWKKALQEEKVRSSLSARMLGERG